MKRIAIVLVIALAGVAAVSAQGYGMWGAPGQGIAPYAAQPVQETVKIDGKLNLVQGHPSVVTGGKTYFVRIPGMLYGFIDSLKEGATVKLEGYATAVPLAADSFFFQATKLTVGGKDYDLSQYAGRGGMMGGAFGGPAAGGMMGAHGGRGGRW
ncbi:MAG: hypothetical protein E4H20_11110 [Spirochaetales bacterium]|nr:MAG: hypothetical protein E4H20_11110 [Spirochaetales bacterium]